MAGPKSFTLGSVLAHGSYFSIYHACEIATGRAVVLKLKRSDQIQSEGHRLLKEAFLTQSSFCHPNLLRVEGFKCDRDLGELIQFESIQATSLLDAARGLSASDREELVIQACRILNFLHSRGLTVGAFRPELFVYSERSDPVASSSDPRRSPVLKLLDYGDPQGPPPHLTSSSASLYTPPEVLQGLPRGFRSDLYGLGILILQLFDALSPISHEPFPSPLLPHSPLLKDLPLSLREVVPLLLQEVPSKRPETAAEVIDLLNRYASPPHQLETDDGIRAAFASVSLIGRATVQKELLSSIQATYSDPASANFPSASVFLLHGEEGVGKSALCSELRKHLEIQGIPYRVAECGQRLANSLSPFQQLIDSLPSGTSEAQTSDPEGSESQLATLDPYARQATMERHAQTAVRVLSRERSILILEDLHHADEETFELFLKLLARAWENRFCIVVTFRIEGFLLHRLERLLESELTILHVRSLPLVRLTPHDVRDLIAEALGPYRAVDQLAQAIFARTQGNPFFALEYLRGLHSQGHLRGGPFRWSLDPSVLDTPPYPSSLEKLFETRISVLPDEARRVLEYFAAFQGPATLALLHEATGMSYAELRGTLEDLRSEGIIEAASTSDTYRVSHDHYAEHLYISLPSSRRRELHHAIGVAYERLHSDNDIDHLIQLATHFLRAGAADKGPAFAIRAAARAKELGATNTAIRLYTQCLNTLTTENPDLRYRVLIDLARLLRQVGNSSQSEAFYLELLLASRRRQDPSREAQALALLGFIYADRGELDKARAYADRASRIHASLGNRAGEAESLLVLTRVAHHEGRFSEALQLAQACQRISLDTCQPLVYGYASNMAGLAFISLRRYADAVKELKAWLRTAEDLGDQYARNVALGNLGLVQLELGRLDEAEKYFDRCLLGSRDHLLPSTLSAALLNSAESYRYRGLFSKSRERCMEALSAAERVDQNEVRHYGIYSLGLLDHERGELGASKASIKRALDLACRLGIRGAEALTSSAFARLLITLGRWADAEEVLEATRPKAIAVGDPLIGSLVESGFLELLAERELDAYLQKQDDDYAELVKLDCIGHCAITDDDRPTLDALRHHVAAIEIEFSRAGGTRIADLVCLYSLGLANIALGRHANALALANSMLLAADESGFMPEKARALMLFGIAHSLDGNPSAAIECLTESRTMADKMNLAMVQARARAELVSVLDSQGRLLDSSRIAIEAGTLIRRMCKTLPDPDDRHHFMAVRWRRLALRRAESRDMTLVSSVQGSSRDDVLRSQAIPTSSAGDSAEAPCFPRIRALVAIDPNGPTADLRTCVASILEEMLAAIGCDRGMIFLLGPEGASEVVVARGLESESIRDASSYCRGVIERAARGEEILIVDTSRDERVKDRRSVTLFHIVSIICVPLRMGPHVKGALYLDSRAGSRLLREEDLELARNAAVRMAARVRDAWELERRREEALLQQRTFCQTYRLDAIAGESPAMKKVFRVLEAVIASDCNVLITGPSGAGKELAARAIHFSGRRKMAPFVPVDCGALQDSLVEAEFFGYRRGAFTGADLDKKGLFEEADKGTLFLDEIANTTTHFQAKLLRVLQSGEFRRVGDTTPRKVDVRIVAASNANIEEAIRQGRFREDLYYRLNVVTVRIPSLSERREDIPALAEQLASDFCLREKISYRGIGESALRALRAYSWPGNVRELKNAVESALILSRDGAVRREFLPEDLREGCFEEIRELLQEGARSISPDARFRETPASGEQRQQEGTAAPEPPTSPAIAETRPGDIRPNAVHTLPERERGRDAAQHVESDRIQAGPEAFGGEGVAAKPAGWAMAEEREARDRKDERERIIDALHRAAGDKSLAARILGCSRMTLYRRMRRLGIDYATGQEAGGGDASGPTSLR